MAYCILLCCNWVPLIGAVSGIAAFVCWVIHWVKIHEYKKRLIAAGNPIDFDGESSIFRD